MGDDITAIEQWAGIFKDPAQLIKKVSLHYALHKAEIKADIASLETDWSTQLYFKAGKDLADLATVAIGPIDTSPTEINGDPADCKMTSIEAIDLAAGFIYGFTDANWQTYMEGCMVPSQPLMDSLCETWSDFKSGNNQKYIAGLALIVSDASTINTEMQACPDALADGASVARWYKYWKNVGTMTLY